MAVLGWMILKGFSNPKDAVGLSRLSQAPAAELFPEVKYLGGCTAAPQGLFPWPAVLSRLRTTAHPPLRMLIPPWASQGGAGAGIAPVLAGKVTAGGSRCDSRAACLGHVPLEF